MNVPEALRRLGLPEDLIPTEGHYFSVDIYQRIKNSYRRLILEHHPDKRCGNTEIAQSLNEAVNILKEKFSEIIELSDDEDDEDNEDNNEEKKEDKEDKENEEDKDDGDARGEKYQGSSEHDSSGYNGSVVRSNSNGEENEGVNEGNDATFFQPPLGRREDIVHSQWIGKKITDKKYFRGEVEFIWIDQDKTYFHHVKYDDDDEEDLTLKQLERLPAQLRNTSNLGAIPSSSSSQGYLFWKKFQCTGTVTYCFKTNGLSLF